MLEWSRRNAEKVRETALASRQRRIEKVREADRARGYRATSLEKVRARKAIHYAVRDGRLERGECVFGPEGCSGRIEAHHADYSKLLEVEWVCQHHHGRFHRRF